QTFKLSSDPLFVDKVRNIVGLYMSLPNRALVLSPHLYRVRNLIERFFNKINSAVASRPDMTSSRPTTWPSSSSPPFASGCVLMSPRPNTTLADLFTPLRFGDLSFAVRASLRPWPNDEFDDGVAYGRQARLRRWTADSFFSAPLVRDGDTGGMRKRSWS